MKNSPINSKQTVVGGGLLQWLPQGFPQQRPPTKCTDIFSIGDMVDINASRAIDFKAQAAVAKLRKALSKQRLSVAWRAASDLHRLGISGQQVKELGLETARAAFREAVAKEQLSTAVCWAENLQKGGISDSEKEEIGSTLLMLSILKAKQRDDPYTSALNKSRLKQFGVSEADRKKVQIVLYTTLYRKHPCDSWHEIDRKSQNYLLKLRNLGVSDADIQELQNTALRAMFQKSMTDTRDARMAFMCARKLQKLGAPDAIELQIQAARAGFEKGIELHQFSSAFDWALTLHKLCAPDAEKCLIAAAKVGLQNAKPIERWSIASKVLELALPDPVLQIQAAKMKLERAICLDYPQVTSYYEVLRKLGVSEAEIDKFAQEVRLRKRSS